MKPKMHRRMGALVLAAGLILPTASAAATWKINPAESLIGFSDTQTGTEFTGHFNKFTAQVVFSAHAPAAGHARVVIDTCSARAGDPQRDAAMPGPNWFSCKLFPEAVFTASHFEALGGDKFAAIGTLSLRNVTKPLTLPFTYTEHGGQADIAGQVTLKRTDFGVGQGAWANDSWVGLDVLVTIRLTATKATP